jgi:prepilin-type N-terminal cleavage/methylation domain-containing protein
MAADSLMPGRKEIDVARARRAYTLFEVLLVMAILVILAAITYPSLDSMYGGYKVQASADQIRGAWAAARARAVDEGRAYRFAVVMGKGNFRVAPDSLDFWKSSEPPRNEDSAKPLVLSDHLPKGISFGDQLPANTDTFSPVDSVDPASWVTVATFLPDGSVRDDAAIAVRMKGTRGLVLRLRALTGVVSVRPFEEGARP